MTKNEILDDIAYARTIAEQGAKTPLLGGSISLMWGLMVVVTLTLHGLTLIEKLPLPPQHVGLLWMIYGLLGTAGSIYLGRKIDNQPGAKSHVNQVGEALAYSMGIMMVAYAITTVFMVVGKGMPVFLYNTIIVFAFALTTINLAVLARLTQQQYMKAAAVLSGAATVMSYVLVQSPYVYFFAALSIVFVQIIPSIIGLRNEPKNA